MSKNLTDYLYAIDTKVGIKLVENACDKLSTIKFNAIAFTGMSGALIAPAVAFKLNRGLILIRKGRLSQCHSRLRVEGDINCNSYIILDDFIATGDTIKRIAKYVNECNGARPGRPRPKLVGIYEYAGCRKNKLHTPTKLCTRDPDLKLTICNIFHKYGD